MRSDDLPEWMRIVQVTHRVTLADLIRMPRGETVIAHMMERIRHWAYVRGLVLDRWPKVIAGGNPMTLEGPTVLVTCVSLPPTPGYDADGRECWEYPT